MFLLYGYIYICYPDLHLEYEFGAALKEDCPCSGSMDDSNCSSLPECTFNMTKNGLCRAKKKLPDGNENYSVHNYYENIDIITERLPISKRAAYRFTGWLQILQM